MTDESDAILLPSRGVDPAMLDERDLLYGIWRDVHFLRNVVLGGLTLYAALFVLTLLLAVLGELD